MEYFKFEARACACFYNYEELGVKMLPQFFRQFRLPDGVASPLAPEDTFLQCQVDEIYNHYLGADCQATVDRLPYDYRESYSNDRFHQHGPDGLHIGRIRDCPGRVVHFVKDEDVVYNKEEREFERPALINRLRNMIRDESHSEDSQHSSDHELEQLDQARDVGASQLKPEEQSLINRFTNQVVDEDHSEDSHHTTDHDHEAEQVDHDHKEDEEATILKPEESSLINRFRRLAVQSGNTRSSILQS